MPSESRVTTVHDKKDKKGAFSGPGRPVGTADPQKPHLQIKLIKGAKTGNIDAKGPLEIATTGVSYNRSGDVEVAGETGDIKGQQNIDNATTGVRQDLSSRVSQSGFSNSGTDARGSNITVSGKTGEIKAGGDGKDLNTGIMIT